MTDIMNMFSEINDSQLWNAFVQKHGPASGAFLQSWDWGEFQKAFGRQVLCVGWLEQNEIIAAAQLVEFPLPFNQKYFYCPRGPVLAKAEQLMEIIAALREETKKRGAMFLRLEPEVGESAWSGQAKKTIELHPAHTLLTDLSPASEILLAKMHPKTRYNIRLAEKKGVEIENGAAFDEVWPLFETTAKRDGFHLHPREYYQEMLVRNGTAMKVFLAVARFAGQVVAANIMVDFAGTRTYLHGASGAEYREVMAPHLLHWTLIQSAKQAGLTSYDWWGVASENAPEYHLWAGITRFKLGFGGRRVSYPGTFDFVLQPWQYRLYQLGRSALRRAR